MRYLQLQICNSVLKGELQLQPLRETHGLIKCLKSMGLKLLAKQYSKGLKLI
jgi:hypothetical protein